jgi:hypothetical protein
MLNSAFTYHIFLSGGQGASGQTPANSIPSPHAPPSTVKALLHTTSFFREVRGAFGANSGKLRLVGRHNDLQYHRWLVL